jgi:hypothetical protein
MTHIIIYIHVDMWKPCLIIYCEWKTSGSFACLQKKIHLWSTRKWVHNVNNSCLILWATIQIIGRAYLKQCVSFLWSAFPQSIFCSNKYSRGYARDTYRPHVGLHVKVCIGMCPQIFIHLSTTKYKGNPFRSDRLVLYVETARLADALILRGTPQRCECD